MNISTKIKRIFNIFNNLVSIVLFVSVVFLLLSVFDLPLGIRFYNVMSGSMSPAIKTGSAIIVKSQSSFSKNDVVTFQSSQSRTLTTHRIVNRLEYEGNTLYSTKGDANDSRDYGYITGQNIVGKVIFTIPYLGYLSSFVKSIYGLIFLIFLPCVLIIFDELKKLLTEFKAIRSKKV